MVCAQVKQHLTIGLWDWQSDQLEQVTAQITPDTSTSAVVLSPGGKKRASAGMHRMHACDLDALLSQSTLRLPYDPQAAEPYQTSSLWYS